MWAYAITGFILILLGIAEADGENELGSSSLMCLTLIPTREMERANGVPNAEEMEVICPGFIGALNCLINILEVNPTFIGEEDSRTVYRSRDLAVEICDVDSRLHRNYVANANCFKANRHKYDECHESAQNIYLEYREHVVNVSKDEKEITADEPRCMMVSYAVACTSTEMLEKCGATAYSTYVELLQRFKYLERFCTEATLSDLRTKFLDFLDLQESEKRVFYEVFDFKRK